MERGTLHAAVADTDAIVAVGTATATGAHRCPTGAEPRLAYPDLTGRRHRGPAVTPGGEGVVTAGGGSRRGPVEPTP